ncbi:MAG TPA: PQQ-binding-like beta-propeller repeat protein [Gemmataceae bacterium]|nr:PQQ-binding-like beta-propeller repeat protein [Gemmataceae bacterium]
MMGRLFICLLAWLAVTVAAPAADWPQFLGPTRNGVSTETGLLQTWGKDGPPKLWERKVGAGFAGPVVSGGRLILFHRVGDEEVVEGLDAASGKPRWKFAYPTAYEDSFGFDPGPRSTPLIAGNHVYTLGAEGKLHCLTLDEGKKVWARDLAADYKPPRGFFGVGTSPLLVGDLLLVNVGGKGTGIVAFNKNTGKEAWRATDHEASYSSPTAATLGGVPRAVFFTREGIVLLDPATGKVRFSKRWRSRMHASVNAAAPLVVGDEVFFSACYGTGAILLKVKQDDCEEVWSNDESMSNHYSTCVARDGFLYGFDGRQEHGAQLRCVEWKTGKVRWTKERFGCGSMILADGHLIILGERGDLVLAEATPAAYREKARASVLGKPCRAQVALANGKLCGRDTNKLVCWDLRKK